MRAGLGAAFMLLTRLPVGRFMPQQAGGMADGVWAYPLVGLVVGGVGAAVHLLCVRIGAPPGLAAIWTVAALMLTTGALHEDGLADMADGFGGGRSAEHKLAIMRDSRIGSFGALALVVSTLIRGTAIAALTQPAKVAPALAAAAALGRGAVPLLLLLLPAARPDGLAARLRGISRSQAALAPLLAAAAAFVILPAGLAGGAIGASAAAALALAGLAYRQVGGYTGDVLGACVIAVECVVMTLLASA